MTCYPEDKDAYLIQDIDQQYKNDNEFPHNVVTEEQI